MPWCEDCAKYHAPSAMSPDGTCPTCGRTLDTPAAQQPVTAKNLDLKRLAAGDHPENEADEGAPWHFKLMMVLMVLYLAWRIFYLFQ